MVDMDSKVSQLREKFLVDLKGKIDGGVYHADDVERVHKQDALLRNVLNSGLVGGDVQKGVTLLDEILMFRMEKKLNDITESDLHPELREKCYLFYKGRAKDGNKILHMKVARTGNVKKHTEERRQLLLFRLFQHYRNNPGEPVVILNDMTDAGPANVNTNNAKYMAKTLFRYFPGMIETSLTFKMKPALEAIFKLLRQFKDSKDTSKPIFVKKSNIQEYIDASELEPHMIKQVKK